MSFHNSGLSPETRPMAKRLVPVAPSASRGRPVASKASSMASLFRKFTDMYESERSSTRVARAARFKELTMQTQARTGLRNAASRARSRGFGRNQDLSPRLDSSAAIDYLEPHRFRPKTWPRISKMRADDLPYIDNQPGVLRRIVPMDLRKAPMATG